MTHTRQTATASPLPALAAALLGAATLVGCDPGESEQTSLFINEVMPSNATTFRDPDATADEYDDWLELYSTADEAIDLEGYFLSDDSADPYRRRLPAGLAIAPGAFLVIIADGEPEQGPAHLPFKLSAAGEELHLTSPGGALIDALRWSDAAADESFARLPDGSGDFAPCRTPTPGAANGTSCGGS